MSNLARSVAQHLPALSSGFFMANLISHTIINHSVRELLGLTFSQYCVADLISQTCHSPKSPHPGWFSSSNEKIANALGLTADEVKQSIDLLIERGAVEKHSKTKDLRTTAKWYELTIEGHLRASQDQQKTLFGDTVAPKAPTGAVRSKSQSVATPVAGSSKDSKEHSDTRRKEITELLDELRTVVGVPMLDDSEAMNRRYCWILIRKFGKGVDGKFNYQIGVKKVRLIIKALEQNDFHRHKTTSFIKLWRHAVEIISSSRDQKGGTIHVE